MAVSGSLRFIGGLALALIGIISQHENPMIIYRPEIKQQSDRAFFCFLHIFNQKITDDDHENKRHHGPRMEKEVPARSRRRFQDFQTSS